MGESRRQARREKLVKETCPCVRGLTTKAGFITMNVHIATAWTVVENLHIDAVKHHQSSSDPSPT